MKLETLHDLLLEELKDLYDAEHQITEALPQMMDAATSQELKDAFQQHLQETQNQIQQLDRAFQHLNQKPSRKTCKAMQGIIREATDMINQNAESSVKDAALIASAQRVEHYEIAGYGTVRAFARQHGHQEVAQIFDDILNQESATDEKLTQIAQQVNERALQNA